MGFTFRKQPRETGLAATGYPYQNTDVKYNKQVVGHIKSPNWMTPDSKWEIWLMRNNEKGWNWVRIKQRFDSEPEARAWIKANAERVIALNLRADDEN